MSFSMQCRVGGVKKQNRHFNSGIAHQPLDVSYLNLKLKLGFQMKTKSDRKQPKHIKVWISQQPLARF